MEAARAALAKKKEEERLKRKAQQVNANPTPTFTVPPPVLPAQKKRPRSPSISSFEEEEESSYSSMDEEPQSSVHPLKAKGVSLEIVPVPPVPKRKEPVQPPKKKVKQDVRDIDSSSWRQSISSSLVESFGKSVADAIPKLVVMGAGLAVTVALQVMASRNTDNVNHPPPRVHSQVTNPNPQPAPSLPMLPTGFQPSNDFPSFISSR